MSPLIIVPPFSMPYGFARESHRGSRKVILHTTTARKEHIVATSTLITHCGAREVTREELDKVEAPPATDSWFPVKHAAVIDTVGNALTSAGFVIRSAKYALSRGDARLFSTVDLATPLGTGISLAVGIRNSTDKSLPLGFIAGSRVFVCDNLAFRSELLVRRKHTRFGQERFSEAICQAVQSLTQFKEAETVRIRRFQQIDLKDVQAESMMLRAYEKDIVSHRLLPKVIQEWRAPSFEEFEERTLWSLFNCFTTVLGERRKTDPQRFAALTIRLQDLLGSEAGLPVDVVATTAA